MAEEITPQAEPQAGAATDTQSVVQTVSTALGGGEPTPGQQSGQETAPQVPESYDFSQIMEELGAGELDETTTNEFSDMLKGMGATQDQAAAMAKYGLTYAQNVAQQVSQTLQTQYVNEVNQWGEQAKTDLGGAYTETLGKAAVVRDYIEQKVPGFTKMLGLTGCGNHVAMIKAMAAIAPLISEDDGKANGGSGASSGILYGNTDFSKY